MSRLGGLRGLRSASHGTDRDAQTGRSAPLLQFRVLYRQFLFRIIDLELLSAHAQGDSSTLLGQFAALLLFISAALAAWAGLYRAGGETPPLVQMVSDWWMEHFLIATTMLTVGMFAVLSWESTFPQRRDVMVLGPFPVRARTMFLAKVAAVGTALGLTLGALHAFAGIAWPLALAHYDSAPAPALVFEPALPPVNAAEFPGVMNRDIAPMLRRLDPAAADGGAGIVIGVSENGTRRVMNYGAAKQDSLFEIGSITKTFTGLLLARMAVEGKLELREPVRNLLPPGLAAPLAGFEITLLDLATHHSGLPRMPDNPGPGDDREKYVNYHARDLFDFIKRHGLERPAKPQFLYSNLGFTVLGEALANRAGSGYAEVVQRGITGPLGMNDTAVALSQDQRERFLQGYNTGRKPELPWDLDALASAGGIRSTAGDLLTYLEAELHPEHSPLQAALKLSQRPRAPAPGGSSIALAWVYDPATGTYAHDGATGGFTSYACFNPRRNFAAVVLMNAHPVYPFSALLGEHVRQRLAGEPAFSLAPVSVPPAGPLRSFAAYWITMVAAGTFMFCCVLTLHGFAAQILPRRWFLRASALLQLGAFCLLVSGYFLQRSPATILLAGSRQPWMAWIPSYWFVGMYQQLSGCLHPALLPSAWRGWIGLAAAAGATAAAYGLSYFRTLRKIVAEPDIAPGLANGWLPRFGGLFETAIGQFSLRSLFRSRQHRMIFSFYLGVGLAFAILFLNAPRELAGPEGNADQWREPSVPLLASTIALMGLWVVGARVVFSLPLDLGANWIFRVMPFEAGPRCLRARRRALWAVSLIPAWALSSACVFALWPWRAAAAHSAILGCFGIVLAEFSGSGVLKIPFGCSYLPGRSHVNVTFVLWAYMLLTGIVGAAVGELEAFRRSAALGGILGVLGGAAVVLLIRNRWLARPEVAELRYEEEPPDKLVGLEL